MSEKMSVEEKIDWLESLLANHLFFDTDEDEERFDNAYIAVKAELTRLQEQSRPEPAEQGDVKENRKIKCPSCGEVQRVKFLQVLKQCQFCKNDYNDNWETVKRRS